MKHTPKLLPTTSPIIEDLVWPNTKLSGGQHTRHSSLVHPDQNSLVCAPLRAPVDSVSEVKNEPLIRSTHYHPLLENNANNVHKKQNLLLSLKPRQLAWRPTVFQTNLVLGILSSTGLCSRLTKSPYLYRTCEHQQFPTGEAASLTFIFRLASHIYPITFPKNVICQMLCHRRSSFEKNLLVTHFSDLTMLLAT